MNASDVDLAVASKAIIFCFNVKTPGSVKTYAENKGVEIRVYKVIYELIDDVRKAMEGLLDPVEVKHIRAIWCLLFVICENSYITLNIICLAFP